MIYMNDIYIDLLIEDGVERDLSQLRGIRKDLFIHRNIGKEIINKES